MRSFSWGMAGRLAASIPFVFLLFAGENPLHLAFSFFLAATPVNPLLVYTFRRPRSVRRYVLGALIVILLLLGFALLMMYVLLGLVISETY